MAQPLSPPTKDGNVTVYTVYVTEDELPVLCEDRGPNPQRLFIEEVNATVVRDVDDGSPCGLGILVEFWKDTREVRNSVVHRIVLGEAADQPVIQHQQR